jgi:anti-sigma-K factor RskA
VEDELMHELVAAYSLDALDDDDHRAFETHLATCAACREEIESFAAPVLALAYGAPPAELPPALRGRVLAAAGEERPNVVPLRPRWAYPALAAAVAASAAALGLGIWAASEHSRTGGSREALTTVPLRGASGSLVLSGGRRGALVVAGLPPAPSGKTYEAWVIEDGKARPAGLFAPAGGRVVVLRLTRPVPAGAEVAVTLERAGGVSQPTAKPVLTSAPA